MSFRPFPGFTPRWLSNRCDAPFFKTISAESRVILRRGIHASMPTINYISNLQALGVNVDADLASRRSPRADWIVRH
jgi:hypothetical protein